MLARSESAERVGSSPSARRSRHEQRSAGAFVSFASSRCGEHPNRFLRESSSRNDVDLDRELNILLGDVEEGDVGPAVGRGQLGGEQQGSQKILTTVPCSIRPF